MRKVQLKGSRALAPRGQPRRGESGLGPLPRASKERGSQAEGKLLPPCCALQPAQFSAPLPLPPSHLDPASLKSHRGGVLSDPCPLRDWTLTPVFFVASLGHELGAVLAFHGLHPPPCDHRNIIGSHCSEPSSYLSPHPSEPLF